MNLNGVLDMNIIRPAFSWKPPLGHKNMRDRYVFKLKLLFITNNQFIYLL